MIRTAHYKYNRYRAHGEELYDLVQDPVEIENLAPDSGYLNVKKEMEYKLNQLAPRASVGIRGRGFAVAKNRPPYPGFQRIAILWRVWAAPK